MNARPQSKWHSDSVFSYLVFLIRLAYTNEKRSLYHAEMKLHPCY